MTKGVNFMPVYKNEKTGSWFCKFYYTDWTGSKKQKKKEGFRTKKEAQEFERAFLSKANASCDMTFGSMVELYMEDCKHRLKPITYANKQFLINTKLLPFFKDMPINSITPATIRRWQNELLSDPNGYSPTYLKTVHNQTSAIFNFAVKYYKLEKNPCRLAGSMGKKNADEMNIWTVEEFDKFIEAVSNKPTSVVIFNLLFWTGIRSGEMFALTIDDFDFKNHTVSISKNYARQNKEDLILPPKTPKSKRVVTLPKFLSDMVKDYSNTIYVTDLNGRIFTQTKHYLLHEMNRGCKLSGVKRIRVHDLRHSHASFLIEKGFSPLLIADRLGHENIETTLQTYSHLYPNKHSEVAALIEEVRNSTQNAE